MNIASKLYISRPEDRDATVQILARNGYTVRIGREHAGKQNKYNWFVEYGKEDTDAGTIRSS